MRQRVFTRWFVSLVFLFAVLNVAGFLTPFGRGKRVTAGFPWVVAEWIRIGDSPTKSEYYPLSALPNLAVAIVFAAGIGALVALSYKKQKTA